MKTLTEPTAPRSNDQASACASMFQEPTPAVVLLKEFATDLVQLSVMAAILSLVAYALFGIGGH